MLHYSRKNDMSTIYRNTKIKINSFKKYIYKKKHITKYTYTYSDIIS